MLARSSGSSPLVRGAVSGLVSGVVVSLKVIGLSPRRLMAQRVAGAPTLAALAFLCRPDMCDNQTFSALLFRLSRHLENKRLFMPGFMGVFRTGGLRRYSAARCLGVGGVANKPSCERSGIVTPPRAYRARVLEKTERDSGRVRTWMLGRPSKSC